MILIFGIALIISIQDTLTTDHRHCEVAPCQSSSTQLSAWRTIRHCHILRVLNHCVRYRTMTAARPKTAIAGSIIAASADLTGASDVVVLVAFVLEPSDEEVVVDVLTVEDAWLVMVCDEGSSEDGEVVTGADVEVLMILEVSNQVALLSVAAVRLLVVTAGCVSVDVVATAASLVALDGVGSASYQLGSVAYCSPHDEHGPAGITSPTWSYSYSQFCRFRWQAVFGMVP